MAHYNLKAVLLETGIKADMLRAWERRYGLPLPQRTPGGHRIYSSRDVETIKWLLARQAEGLTISRAIDLFREQSARGLDPLPQPPEVPLLTADTGLPTLRQQWLKACIAFNETVAEQVLNQACAIHPLEQVCVEVLLRGLAEIGEMWFEDQASVQQEHFASALAMRRLDTLISATPAPSRPQTILVGCPTDEWHTFVPLLLTLFLRRRGFNVIYLGADVPRQRFEETLAAIRPEAVILAAQQLHTAGTLVETALSIASQAVRVAYGGRVFNRLPELHARIPGHFLGADLMQAAANLELVLKSPPPAPPAVRPPAELEALRRAFAEKRPAIELELAQRLKQTPLALEETGPANLFLAKNILSTLTLGSIDLLRAEIEWLQTLLQIKRLNSLHLGYYLDAYAEAVRKVLGETGEPLAAWLTNYSRERQAAHAV